MSEMNIEEIKKIIKTELTTTSRTGPSFRKYALQITKLYCPPKKTTEERIEKLYQQLLQIQEQSEIRWQEWNKKWEENQRRWKENQKIINENLKRLDKMVISTMVDPRAKPVAEKLGIEIYTHSDEFIEKEEKNIEEISG